MLSKHNPQISHREKKDGYHWRKSNIIFVAQLKNMVCGANERFFWRK
jgi:hypothetical protein